MPNTDLEVHHCRVLVAVKAHGGVAAAARALGLAQSTVSETLLSLERVLGAPVTLRRRGKPATLTAAAETLIPHARTLIASSEAALAAFTAKGGETIRLGMVESISSYLLPGPLGSFRQRWPQVDVRITIGLCDELRKRVRDFDLDAALTLEGAERTGEGRRLLAPARLSLFVSQHNPLNRSGIRRADLELQTFLLADPGGAFNELLRGWLGTSATRSKLESAGSIDGVKRGVLHSDVIGVLPTYAIREELSSGSLAALHVRETLPALALNLTTPAPLPETSPLHHLIEQIGGASHQ